MPRFGCTVVVLLFKCPCVKGSKMVASIFVFFVAAGITIASFVYGFGGLFPLLASMISLALFFQCAAFVMRRREGEIG